MPNKITVILILIIAIAIFFRFWQFGSIPPGLYQDEAMNGADALSSLKTGNFSVFYQNNNGREGMIVWLDALAIKALGTQPWALRLFPALAGVLAVLGLYFLAKELLSVEVALASSFFMAVSFWAVNFSRIGFRAGLMLLFLIWSFYFLIREFKLSKSDFYNFYRSPTSIILIFLAGILFGLGFYTYISYRFAPVLVAAFFIPYLIKYGNKKLWTGFLLFTITGFIIALPIGLYFLNNPGDFFGRSGQVAIWSAENPLKAVAISTASTLGMFNVVGDFNWRHNYAGSSELFWPVGILFLLGLGISVKRLGFSEKFMLAWLGIFLLPNILSTEGNPHALRALGAMPAAMIFSGIGLLWLYGKIQNYVDHKRVKKEIFWLLIVFLVFIAGFEFNKYFNHWASNPRVFDAFSGNQVELANYLNGLPEEVKKYSLWHPDDRPTDNGLPVSAQTVYFLTRGKEQINYLRADETAKIELGKNSTVITPIYFNTDLLHNLQKKYPKSRIEIIGLNVGAVIVP